MSKSKKYLARAIIRDAKRIPAQFLYHGARWHEYRGYKSVAAEISIESSHPIKRGIVEKKVFRATRIVDAFKGVGMRINATQAQIDELQSILQKAELNEEERHPITSRISTLEAKHKKLRRPRMYLGAMIRDMGAFAKRQGNEQAAKALFDVLGL